MSTGPLAVGTILWTDLTVEDAPRLCDFYSAVIGWRPEALDMGDYCDYSMLAQSTQQAVAGVCHARGSNAQLPPQWLIYVAVDDLDTSLQRCLVLGGSVVDGPRPLGEQRFCVIRDPAGAMMALVGPRAQPAEA